VYVRVVAIVPLKCVFVSQGYLCCDVFFLDRSVCVCEFCFDAIDVVVHCFEDMALRPLVAWLCVWCVRCLLFECGVCMFCCSNDTDTLTFTCLRLYVCVCLPWPLVALLNVCFICIFFFSLCCGGLAAVDFGICSLDLCRA